MSAAPVSAIRPANAVVKTAMKKIGDGIALLATVRPFDFDDAELMELSADTHNLVDRLDAVSLDQVAEIDRREVARRGAGIGVSSTAELLEKTMRMTPTAAKETVNTARALEDLPVVREALHDGDIGRGHASAIAATVGTADVTPEVKAAGEEDLVGLATRGASPAATATVGRIWRSKVSPDEADRSDVQKRAARRLRVFADQGGMVTVDGRLDPVAGQALIDALDRQVGRIRVKYDKRTSEQLYADALGDLVTHRGTDGPTAAPEARVMVICTPDALAGIPGAEPDTTLSGIPLAPRTLAELACDSILVRLVMDAQGRIIDIAKDARLVPAWLKNAVIARDRACVVCGSTRQLIAHHVKERARDHGPTIADNLVALCRECHHRLHEQNMMLCSVFGDWQILPYSPRPDGDERAPPDWMD